MAHSYIYGMLFCALSMPSLLIFVSGIQKGPGYKSCLQLIILSKSCLLTVVILPEKPNRTRPTQSPSKESVEAASNLLADLSYLKVSEEEEPAAFLFLTLKT